MLQDEVPEKEKKFHNVWQFLEEIYPGITTSSAAELLSELDSDQYDLEDEAQARALLLKTGLSEAEIDKVVHLDEEDADDKWIRQQNVHSAVSNAIKQKLMEQYGNQDMDNA